jgi:hypothetical protein
MSRTYRRRGERHDYDWVLRDYRWVGSAPVPFLIDSRSREGRRTIARFHSDACWTFRSTAPRWYRRIFDHRQQTLNRRQLRRWLADPSYDPGEGMVAGVAIDQPRADAGLQLAHEI